MKIREMLLAHYMGFDVDNAKEVEMGVDFLFALAKEEAPFRSDEEFDSLSKEILFGKESLSKSKKLKHLLDNWDTEKCEPLDIKKEGTIYMINDGFHRIIVAKELNIPKLKVKLSEGVFLLSKHITFADLPQLLEMIKLSFPKYKTFDSLIKLLTNSKLDKEKMKHTSLCYGGVGE